MDAHDLNFIEFLGQRKTRFIIPVYQRNYDWKVEHCKQLLDDILQCGRDNDVKAHFLGSIVYIHDDVYSVHCENSFSHIREQAAAELVEAKAA